jgi:hypothetical protein
MSEELYQQDAQRPAELAAGEPIPDAVGAGRAQRSEPERSDGERSGARPAPPRRRPPADSLRPIRATPSMPPARPIRTSKSQLGMPSRSSRNRRGQLSPARRSYRVCQDEASRVGASSSSWNSAPRR